MPNIVAMAPRNEDELADMMFTATRHAHPTFIRYPRGAAEGTEIKDEPSILEIGKAEVVENFKDTGKRKIAKQLGIGVSTVTRILAEAA